MLEYLEAAILDTHKFLYDINFHYWKCHLVDTDVTVNNKRKQIKDIVYSLGMGRK